MARAGAARAERYGALLDALRGLTWPARAPVRGGTAGTHRSRLRGVSPEFTEYRPYRQGDDTRRLDWRLLARTDRAYLRVTSDRATLGTILVLDSSASMAYPPGVRSKWQLARALAVGLAGVAHASGDPVGVVVPAAAGTRLLAPRTRRGVVGEVVRLLETVEAGGDAPVAPAAALAAGARRLVLLSDWLGDAEDVLRAVRERVAAGSEAHAVHVVAREELSPADATVMARDPERPDLERPLAESTRTEYERAFAGWREALARDWLAAGAAYTLVVTDEAADRAVRRIVGPRGALPAARP